jgi:4a-hydroxytetrahydrobiopterin dehydratase
MTDGPGRVIDVTDQTAPTKDWARVGRAAFTFYPTASLADAIDIVRSIGEAIGPGHAHPDIDIRPDGVTVRLLTAATDVFGLTGEDVAVAGRISAAAARLGLTAVPEAAQHLVVTIDALVVDAVLPFWHAVLDYEPRLDAPGKELVDPRRRGPGVYFQQMDAPRTERNRIHLDVWVPFDRAEARVEAALAAGGRLVSDEHAPGWWILADPEGNEACVATFVAAG